MEKRKKAKKCSVFPVRAAPAHYVVMCMWFWEWVRVSCKGVWVDNLVCSSTNFFFSGSNKRLTPQRLLCPGGPWLQCPSYCNAIRQLVQFVFEATRRHQWTSQHSFFSARMTPSSTSLLDSVQQRLSSSHLRAYWQSVLARNRTGLYLTQNVLWC